MKHKKVFQSSSNEGRNRWGEGRGGRGYTKILRVGEHTSYVAIKFWDVVIVRTSSDPLFIGERSCFSFMDCACSSAKSTCFICLIREVSYRFVLSPRLICFFSLTVVWVVPLTYSILHFWMLRLRVLCVSWSQCSFWRKLHGQVIKIGLSLYDVVPKSYFSSYYSTSLNTKNLPRKPLCGFFNLAINRNHT